MLEKGIPRLALMMLVIIIFLSSTVSGLLGTTNVNSPIFIDCSLNSTKVYCGDTMTVFVHVFDFCGIDTIQAKFHYENGYDIVNLTLCSGSKFNGQWQGNWNVHDTITKEYHTIVTAYSRSGFSSSYTLSWWDPTTWWDSSWSYRMPLTVTNSGGDLTNYQIKIELDSLNVGDNFNWDEDYDAMRVTYYNISTDSEEICPFWIESWNSSSQEASIWTNVSYLQGGSDTTLYLYYQNPSSSSSSDGNTTFDFFDDFQGSSLDTNKWQIDSSDYSVLNSEFRINTGAISIKNPLAYNLNDGYILEGKIKYPSNSGGYSGTLSAQSSHYTQGGNSGSDATSLYMRNSGSRNVYRFTGSGSSSNYNCGYGNVWVSSNNIWYILGAKFYSSGVYLTRDRSNVYGPYGCSWTKNIQYISLGAWHGSSSYNIQDTIYDWILVRKYVSTEPIYSVESEEIGTPSKPILTFPVNNSSIKEITPVLQWIAGENADNHSILIDDEINLSDGDEWINESLGPSDNTYTIQSGESLSEGLWFWIVIANNTHKKNSSEKYNFIVDTTAPITVALKSPTNNSSIDNNRVSFSWNQTFDSTINSSDVSNINCYQLQVDDDSDFSSLTIDDNTSDNSTFSMNKTIEGNLFWRVRAWDHAGNPGEFSEIRRLTVFDFSLTSDSTTVQMKRGESGSINLDINLEFGDAENITLNGDWIGDNKPSNININISNNKAIVPFDSTITFNSDSNAATGIFTYMINGTSDSGIKHSKNVTITVFSMLFSLDGFPREISLLRNDESDVTISVEFDQGTLDDVILTGDWVGKTPGGVVVEFNPLSGTPPYDSKITFSTSKSSPEGNYVYRIEGEGSGVIKTVNVYVEISTNLSLMIETYKTTYEKGQEIQLSGIVKNPADTLIQSGTAEIFLSAQNWSDHFSASIKNGIFSEKYYISFDKPDGIWDIIVNATDSDGHKTSSPVNTSIIVETPEYYDHFNINILNPIVGQIFKRGENIIFTITVTNEKDEKIQGVDVKAWFPNGEKITFSEGSFGVYSNVYDIDYAAQIGNLSLYVEGKKIEEGKLKAGFNYIEYRVQAVKPIVEIIEPKKSIFEVGESINIKIKVTYPDGTPLEKGIITSIGSDNEEIIFTKSGIGIYTAQYTPTTHDVGNWTMKLIVGDTYSNFVDLKGENIQVIHTKTFSYFLRYWWITVIGIISMASIIIYFINKKLRVSKLNLIKDKIIELEELKKRNAIMYFSEGSITRESYDSLLLNYETKISQLSKKHRLLEKKMEK